MRSLSIIVCSSVLLAFGSLGAVHSEVLDVWPGAPGSNPTELTSAYGRMLFAADHPEHGRELFATDGTSAGTFLVEQIAPGAASSDPEQLVVHNGWVYFAAGDASEGIELWRTTGTQTQVLTALRNDAKIGPIVSTDLGLFFGVEFDSGTSLWYTQGDPAVTFPIKSFGSDVRIHELVWAGSRMFFTVGISPFDNVLWVSDGTSGGTAELSPADAPYWFEDLTPYESNVVMMANHPLRNREPWISDGTDLGTVEIENLMPGNVGSHPFGFSQFGADIRFVADFVAQEPEPEIHRGVFTTDGTSVDLVQDLGGIGDMGAEEVSKKVGSVLYFSLNQFWLWRSNGTSFGTKRVLVPAAEGPPAQLAHLGPFLYFTSESTGRGRELWRTGINPDEAQRITDLAPGAASGFDPAQPAPKKLNGLLFMVADDGSLGDELHVMPEPLFLDRFESGGTAAWN